MRLKLFSIMIFVGLLSFFIINLSLSGIDAAIAAQDSDTSANKGAEGQPSVPQEPIAIKGSKKTVMFPHSPHSKIECVTCHHKVNDKPNFEKCSTAGCHDDLTAKKGENSLYFVIHNKSDDLKHQTCLRCHTSFVEDKPDLKKVMTGCTGSKCHPGEKKEEKS